jgi:hypothetical protein
MWKCECGRHAADGIKQCRGCGAPKAAYAPKPQGEPRATPKKVIDDRQKEYDRKNRAKLARVPNTTDENFAVSTFKRKK